MTAERPDIPDDLDQAYARAHALADDGHAPSTAVRANVLAAARDIAAQAAARIDTGSAAAPSLVPVAAPVGAVGRERGWAINLPSWRVRSGAALCAALLIGVAGWRFDASRRSDVDTQMASADQAGAAIAVLPPPPPAKLLPRELPPPAFAPSAPPVTLPRRAGLDAAREAANPAAPDNHVMVAQAERSDRASGLSPAESDARAHISLARPVAPAVAADVPVPPPAVIVASAEPNAATATAAAAPAPIAAMAARPAPAPAPAARIAPPGETMLAAAQPQARRVEINGAQSLSSGAVSDALKKSAPDAAGTLVGASVRLLPMPLQAAVDRGDIGALKTLLADSATLVDAPDAAGRTALLHAVVGQHAMAVRLLVAAGADPDRADHAGLTPRAAARAGADADIAALLPAPR